MHSVYFKISEALEQFSRHIDSSVVDFMKLRVKTENVDAVTLSVFPLQLYQENTAHINIVLQTTFYFLPSHSHFLLVSVFPKQQRNPTYNARLRLKPHK